LLNNLNADSTEINPFEKSFASSTSNNTPDNTISTNAQEEPSDKIIENVDVTQDTFTAVQPNDYNNPPRINSTEPMNINPAEVTGKRKRRCTLSNDKHVDENEEEPIVFQVNNEINETSDARKVRLEKNRLSGKIYGMAQCPNSLINSN
jgi:hypothetical protein